jgi:hypothetical protein
MAAAIKVQLFWYCPVKAKSPPRNKESPGSMHKKPEVSILLFDGSSRQAAYEISLQEQKDQK